jgi:hypothetical protein
MATYKERMSLLGRYGKLHAFKYGERPKHNLNAEQWNADGLIESYGLPKCYDLLDYYFDSAQLPNWKQFANQAEKVIDSMESQKKDIEDRAERRRMAKEWLNG